ncbi:hypothetical protein Skr01_05310 [Sphaerisporangium krabiense]|uniref:Uncharacterized protein n=1 Tax=Sphaerisporangium krabiense TaxID=763782 RepID=A0A7W8Z7D8_9ACTN|nr:hypothetical protein [Sphaerisporangium krabiense]GII60446.1 hypothetical protein Skr01_05310 [Sphaerisporangium krabiense]
MTSGNGADPAGVAPGSRWALFAFQDVPVAAPERAPVAKNRVVMP